MAPQRNINRPTDVARRDETINQKLQLYGIYCAFSQGKLPSNDQIDIALNSALQSRALTKPSNRLSDEGHKLVDDLADVIEKAKVLLLSKNQGQLIQQFVWNVDRTGRSLSQDGKIKSEKLQGPVSKEAAQQDGQNALEGLKQLAKLIVSNGQFRKLLSDASILARSMVGDAATGIAGRVHPSEEQLSQIDTPAEDNSWVEAPNFDQSDIKSRVKSQYSKVSSWTKKKQPNSAASSTAVADGATDDLTLPDDGATVSSSSSRRKEWGGKAKEYWDKKMPAERQEATMDRLRKMIVEIQGHDDYQNAIVTLLNLLDTYGSHGRHYSSRGVGQVQGVYKSDEIQAAEKNLKTVIERFANSTSMDDFFDAVKKIQECAQNDPELRNWLQSLNTYFRRCLQETGYVIQPEAKEEWRVLSDHGQQLAQHKYRPEFKRLSYEAQSFVKQFDADQTNKAFGQSVQKLCLDLGQDENGKPKFKPHLVKDLTTVIIPSFLEHLHYVPLPRMEYSDKMIDLIVENLIVESDNLMPNLLELKSDNHWRWGRMSVTGGNKNKLLLNISGIQMDLRDVTYYVNKKTGFPRLTDSGLMDIFLGGNGLSVLIEMETADRFSPTSKTFGGDGGLPDGAHYFRASQVKVNLSTLKIKVRKSNHKFLIAIMKPILLRLLKPIIAKVAANEAKKAIAELDEVVFEIRNEAKQVKEEDKKLPPDQRGKQATYSRYAELVKNRYQTNKEAKAKANEAKPGDSKFQFVITQDQTMFPNIKLPPGISSKTMQYRSMAGQGTEWQSPVFKIGGAKPTSPGKIPAPSKIVRKSTWTGYKDPKLNDLNAGNKAALSKLDSQGVGRGQGVGTTMNPQDVRRQPLQEVDNEQGLPMDRQTYQRATDPNYSQMGGNGALSKENGSDNRYYRDSKMDKNLGSRDALHPSQGYYHNPTQDMNIHGDHGDNNLSQSRPYDMPSYTGPNTKVPAAYDGTNGNGKFHRYSPGHNQTEGTTPMHLTAAEKMAAATLGAGAAGMGGAAYLSHNRSKSASKDYGSDYGSNTSVPITAAHGSSKSDASSNMTPLHPSDGEHASPSAAEALTIGNANTTSIQGTTNPLAVATSVNTVPTVPGADIPNSHLAASRSFPGRPAPATPTERPGAANKGRSHIGIASSSTGRPATPSPSLSAQQAASGSRGLESASTEGVGLASSGSGVDPMMMGRKHGQGKQGSLHDASVEDDYMSREVMPGTLPISVPDTPDLQSPAMDDEVSNRSGVLASHYDADAGAEADQPTATNRIAQALYSVRDRLSGSYQPVSESQSQQASQQESESQHPYLPKSDLRPPTTNDQGIQTLMSSRSTDDANPMTYGVARGPSSDQFKQASDATISKSTRWNQKARDSAQEGLSGVRVIGNDDRLRV